MYYFSYQINAKTELAIRYNDVSPLENHHCAVTFRILANPTFNIFANVKEEQFRVIRSVTSLCSFHLFNDMHLCQCNCK